jgi:hypothetical protein
MKKIVLVLLLSMIGQPSFSSDDYHVVKKIPIPGTGSWDYLTLDATARRLYGSHGTRVEVLDDATRYRTQARCVVL